MWITFAIVASFVIATIAMAYFGMEAREAPVEVDTRAPADDPACCGLCRTPLRRSATSEQIVLEVERRIDAELREIASAARGAAGSRASHA